MTSGPHSSHLYKEGLKTEMVFIVLVISDPQVLLIVYSKNSNLLVYGNGPTLSEKHRAYICEFCTEGLWSEFK